MLFIDFSENNKNDQGSNNSSGQNNNKLKIYLKEFINISEYLNTGLNKIQLKKTFITILDLQNKGFCTLS